MFSLGFLQIVSKNNYINLILNKTKQNLTESLLIPFPNIDLRVPRFSHSNYLPLEKYVHQVM